ncbi:hypothetical protein XPA_006155 [Xanthoria parietina]
MKGTGISTTDRTDLENGCAPATKKSLAVTQYRRATHKLRKLSSAQSGRSSSPIFTQEKTRPYTTFAVFDCPPPKCIHRNDPMPPQQLRKQRRHSAEQWRLWHPCKREHAPGEIISISQLRDSDSK